MPATGGPTDRQSDLETRTDPAPGAPEAGPSPRHTPDDQPVHPPTPQQSAGPGPAGTFTLLVVGEDPTGAIGMSETTDGAGGRLRIRRARNLTEAERLLTDDVTCVLLDLHLPPSGVRARQPPAGLDALRRLLRLAPGTAVLVLADGADAADLAARAVRVGAQDYLFRDGLDASLLDRAMRYAVERKRADLAQLQLTESRLLTQQNARLERGLLPTPLLDGAEHLRFSARYRPGRSRALLGGDFYDVVRTPDGTVHAMIGDVCGHGPDEAALGVALRIAWRALTFAGLSGDRLLRTLQRVLECERPNEEIFATLCTLDIAPNGSDARLCLAGHPAPLLLRGGHPAQLPPEERGGPAIGLLGDAEWEPVAVPLGAPGEAWSLMLYTDGLIEGRIGEGSARLGTEGLIALVERRLRDGLCGEDLLDATVTRVRELNGGELADDVAVMLLEHRRPGAACR